MSQFGKMTIIGVGLIGGSAGIAALNRGVAGEVWGVARREETIKTAVKKKAISRGTLDLAEGVKDADFIIAAVPVGSVPDVIRKCLPYLKPGVIITDAGSTKGEIVSQVNGFIPGDAVFIGSHPVAGSEKSGVEFADGALLDSSTCIITPLPGQTSGAEDVRKFWEALGMKVILMSPREHDRLLALTSHLPHVVSCGLVNLVSGYMDRDGRVRSAAAGGFRDTTRIAASSPQIWHDIFSTNRDNLADFLKEYIELLRGIEKVLRSGDGDALLGFLEKARTSRDEITRQSG